MAKRYKPGQFCSLGGTLYRIKKRPTMVTPCFACGYKCCGGVGERYKRQYKPNYDQLFRDCATKLPGSCYPVEIKPKRQG